MIMHWIRFNEWCAQHSLRGKVRDVEGIHAAWSHTVLIINNLTTPTGPVFDRRDLRECAQAAIRDASPHQLPWMFGVPDPWMPCSVDDAAEGLSEVGLRHQMYMTVMECDGPLADPVRPLPTDVEVRRVDSRGGAIDALNINCRAYGMPLAVTEDVVNAQVYFSDPQREFGMVVYTRDGIPASTATAIDFGNWIYIAAVATDPDHRQKGYAELAMRAALEAAPRKPTALDASRSGEPLYAQMGYQRRFKWNFWVQQ